MKLKNFGLLLVVFSLMTVTCTEKKRNATDNSKDFATESKASNYKVVFIELGSVKCVPCRMMQKVMKKVESRYGDQVKVVFYDIWTEEGKPYKQKYGVRAIPTQVFLDKNGQEYFRHIGFLPFEKVQKILSQQGVK